MRYLITGFSGFVSYFFLDYLNRLDGEPIEILGIDINENDFEPTIFSRIKINFQKVNLLDYNTVEKLIMDFQPDRVLHLASFSSVAKSWITPIESFANNTNIFLNLLEAIRKYSINCRILSIGSSEEYGNVDVKDLPLIETHPVNPLSPYAVARVSQELMSKVYVDSLKLDIVLTRSFNHFGPRQKDLFVIPTFIKQVCQAKLKGDSRVILNTGDVDVVRDFLDVRDVIRAYYALFKYGKSGELYNVCSGNGISLRDLIKKIGEQNKIDIKVVVDNDKIRPNDNKRIIGSNDKIRAVTSWSPSISLEQSLCDISGYWMKQLVCEKEIRK